MTADNAANDQPTVAARLALRSSTSTPLRDSPAPQFSKSEARGGLRRADLDPASPTAQFHAWFAAAEQAGVPHPETCTLSTASLPDGRVSARMIYLKELEVSSGAFVLYTNMGTSRKAADLATNPHASLTFWWAPLERQVRVEGRAERLTPAESQTYFDTRVRGSRIGAWASRQSQVLPPDGAVEGDDGRALLNRWVGEAEDRFRPVEGIPVPDFWGGLRVMPDRVEFWQGRESRLHDRFSYERVSPEGEEAKWTLERLSP